MKLTRLEIYGFKSFPQRTDIRFDDGITGIVGPNGSGKSNIADAVRWVLGEQSAKALRGAKMEDVIFAGTQKRRLMPYCEVSLIFDNADGKLKSPHTEVMVTRRAYRSGEGEYYLNKKSCRLKDIVELFHDTGIGREGYSIIGQGHIDVILSGRGEERRAAFEEAAGIMGYRSRKEEAERKLNRTQEHLLRVGDLLEELGSRLQPLKEQSETARHYLELSARLKALDANIFISRHNRLDKRIAALQETQDGIRALLTGHEAELAACQLERQQADHDLALAEEESDRLSALLLKAEERLREQAVRAERGAQALQAAKEEAARNEESLQGLTAEITELSGLLAGSGEHISQYAQSLASADTALKELEETAASTQAAQNKLESALEAHRSRILQAANSRSDARERHARQQAMLSQAQERLQAVKSSEARLEEALELAKQGNAQAEERLAATRAQVSGLQEALKQAEERLNSRRESFRTAEEAIQERRLANQRDRARLNTMEEVARSHEGFFQPARQALLYGKNNPKVHGAVAHLLSVPEHLETAVEMLLGSALQNIVTEDEETAQELINYLRDRRFGRTTFLPLSAVRGRTLSAQERGVLSQEGCLGVASELVSYEVRFAGIAESLLGRAVIAKDLDAAIRISRAGRQAFHVVTLQGDVMRAGGAMTGGSVQSRTVSLLGREREIKQLEEELAQRQQQLDELAARQARERSGLQEMDEEVRRQRLRVQDEEIGIAREEEQFKRAQERLQAALDELVQTGSAREQLAEMIDQLTLDLSEADAQSRLVEEDRGQMEREETRLKNELSTARSQAEQAREQLEAHRESRGQTAHRLDLLQRDRNRFEKDLQTLTSRKERLEHGKAGLDEKITSAAAALAGLEQTGDTERDAAARLREEAAGSQAARRELSARQAKLSDRAERAHEAHSQDSQRLHKGELSLARLTEEQHSITQALWNTHELTYALAQEYVREDRFDLAGTEKEAGDIRKEIRELGAINIHAMDEYAATKARFDDLGAQRDDAQQAREDLLSLIKRLQGQMEKQFVREFALLSEYFTETFKRLFNGGQASLSLADPSQPLECEIQIKAQPPGKKLQLLSLLSGGERTLTAIAILFAMLKLKPTPFCILDEIEAALDDANIYSFASYLTEYKQGTQFIVITHRKGTMESCDTLYGVTMREKGVSDMISINLQEYTA